MISSEITWQNLVPLYNTGNYDHVIAGCNDALNDAPGSPQLLFLQANAYHARGDDEQALPLFLRLYSAVPDNEQISSGLVAVLRRMGLAALHRGDHATAIVHLRQASSVASRVPEIQRDLVGALTTSALTHQSAGRWTEAAVAMDQAHQLSKNEALGQYTQKLRGLAEAANHNVVNAIIMLSNSISWNQLGASYDVIRIILQDLLPLHDRGFIRFLLSLNKNPEPHAEDVYFVSHMLLVRDQPLAAAQELCAALRETLGESDILDIALGAASDIAGCPAEARQHYDTVLRRCPDHPNALQGIAALDQLPPPTPSPPPRIIKHLLPKTRLNIAIYGNCQGQPLRRLLRDALAARYQCEITFIRNYEPAQAYSLQRARTAIERADVLLYQPQRVTHAEGTAFAMPPALGEWISQDCITLSFPYVFNAALWPIVYDGDCLISSERFVGLAAGEGNADRLWELYLGDELDFEYARRWDYTMRILAEREKWTDVKLAPFITREIRRQCLFTGHRHPRHPVYAECGRQILELFQTHGIQNGDIAFEDVANGADFIEYSRRLFSCEFLPIDRTAQAHYQFEWVQAGGEDTAARYYHVLLQWAARKTLRVLAGHRADA